MNTYMTAAHMDARSLTAYVGEASGEVCAHVLWPELRVRQVLQTRGAAAVRCIVTADLLDPCGNGGLAVGCARGSIGYYHGGRTAICTHSLPFAVAALARHRAEDGQPAIAASDVGGTVLVFGLLGPLRRLRLQDFVAVASRLRHPAGTAIESVRVLDATGRRAGRQRSDEPRAQLLVAAGGPSLLRIRNDGSLACTLEAPGAVTALSVDGTEDEDAGDGNELEQPGPHDDGGGGSGDAGDVGDGGGGDVGDVGDVDGHNECSVDDVDATAQDEGSGGERRASKRSKVAAPCAATSAATTTTTPAAGASGASVAPLEPLERCLGAVLVGCADGTVRSYPTMRCVAMLGAPATRMDASRWRSHGLIVCTGRFDGVLVATRTRAQDGASVRRISGAISGAISGGPVRHLLAGTGWALGAWLLSEPDTAPPDPAPPDTAPQESRAAVDEVEFSHRSSHRSSHRPAEASSKRESPRLRVCTVTARPAAPELPRVVLSPLSSLLSS